MCLLSKLLLSILFLVIPFITLTAQDIHEAVKDKEIEQIKILLKKNPKLAIAKDPHGNTPLHLAAETGFEKIAELLLSRTENVNIKNNRGLTPLFPAVLFGRENITRMLLAKGAETCILSDIGWYPIHYAVYANQVNILKFLVEFGADKNIEDKNGRTPLELALFRGNKNIIDILLCYDAKIRIKTTTDGIQDLHAAARIGHSTLFEKLVQMKVDINSKDYMRRTLLHNAAAGGLLDIVRDLMAKGQKLDVRDIYGSTSLHEACYNGHKETVSFLISKGADIHSKRPDGSTPFYLAKKMGYEDIVSILESKGAKDTPLRFPDITDEYLGQNPPGRTAELYTPGLLSTGVLEVFNETRCNSRQFVFSREHPHSPPSNPVYYPELITEIKNGKWTTPALAPQFRTPHDPNLSLTPDEDIIYTRLRRTLDGKTIAPWGFNLWIARKTDEG